MVNVRSKDMRQDEDYWYVVVQPDKEDDYSYGYYSYGYYGRLAEAEGDIEDYEDLKILLVPVLPG